MKLPELVALAAPDFDLVATLNCGQVFHWRPAGAGWVGTVGDAPIYAEQRGEYLLVPRGSEESAARYFALDHPMAQIYASFPRDPAMDAALAACRGLRIIRQPLWECLATFITSALKQVAHIAQISHLLRARFGQRAGTVAGTELWAYPTPARIAGLQEADLRACGLGFRARSVLETAQIIAEAAQRSESLLESVRALDRPAALEAICKFRGVGTKVANCALLFAYEHLDAFPIDVWIERVLRERYFTDEPDVPVGRLQRFAEEYFGPYGGYAQQYLFHHARLSGRKKPSGIEPPQTPIRRVHRSRAG